jgi:hypothetical protein
MRLASPFARLLLIASLQAAALSACAAQRAASSLAAAAIPASVGDEELLTSAFRALLDEVIGDSADRVCLSVVASADSTTSQIADADPRPGVFRALRGHMPTVSPYSACAADERNYGPARALLRLRDFSLLGADTLLLHADAVGDHTAHYECLVPRAARAAERARCRILSRD